MLPGRSQHVNPKCSCILQAQQIFKMDQGPGLSMHEDANGGGGTFSYTQVPISSAPTISSDWTT